MPFKFQYDKQYIPKEYDRRRKLTDEDKEQIKKLYGKISQRKLAKAFGVSRSTIIFIGDPEKHKRNLLMRELRGGSMVYYNKDDQRNYIKTYRRYKQQLAKQNLLEERK